jgi:hypothetical protein
MSKILPDIIKSKNNETNFRPLFERRGTRPTTSNNVNKYINNDKCEIVDIEDDVEDDVIDVSMNKKMEHQCQIHMKSIIPVQKMWEKKTANI